MNKQQDCLSGINLRDNIKKETKEQPNNQVIDDDSSSLSSSSSNNATMKIMTIMAVVEQSHPEFSNTSSGETSSILHHLRSLPSLASFSSGMEMSEDFITNSNQNYTSGPALDSSSISSNNNAKYITTVVAVVEQHPEFSNSSSAETDDASILHHLRSLPSLIPFSSGMEMSELVSNIQVEDQPDDDMSTTISNLTVFRYCSTLDKVIFYIHIADLITRHQQSPSPENKETHLNLVTIKSTQHEPHDYIDRKSIRWLSNQ